LRPIRRKQISEKVALELELSAETVDEIASCYFKILQRKMSNLEHERIAVKGFGTFVIKRKKVEEKLKKYLNYLAQEEKAQQPDIRSIEAVKSEIAKYENMLARLDMQEEKRKLKEEEKINYKIKKHESD
jgi:nucleoid DNA-binding protein